MTSGLQSGKCTMHDGGVSLRGGDRRERSIGGCNSHEKARYRKVGSTSWGTRRRLYSACTGQARLGHLSFPKTRSEATDSAAAYSELPCESFIVVMQAAKCGKRDHPAPGWRMHDSRVRHIHR